MIATDLTCLNIKDLIESELILENKVVNTK